MGTEALWIPALMAVAGAGVGAYNTRRTANKQDAAAVAGQAKQRETQRLANARINKTLSDARAVNPDDARKNATQQYMNVIRAKTAQANAGLAPAGVSSAYDQAAMGAQAQAPAYAAGIGDLFSRIDAGDRQREQENTLYGNMGMDLDVLGGNVRGDDFLTRLRVGGIRRNPWLDALSAGLGAYGGGMGGSGGGGGGGFTGTSGYARSIGPRP